MPFLALFVVWLKVHYTCLQVFFPHFEQGHCRPRINYGAVPTGLNFCIEVFFSESFKPWCVSSPLDCVFKKSSVDVRHREPQHFEITSDTMSNKVCSCKVVSYVFLDSRKSRRIMQPLWADPVDFLTAVYDHLKRIDESIKQKSSILIDKSNLDKHIISLTLSHFAVDPYVQALVLVTTSSQAGVKISYLK